MKIPLVTPCPVKILVFYFLRLIALVCSLFSNNCIGIVLKRKDITIHGEEFGVVYESVALYGL